MDISFVIPAYNASKTIVRCLDSIISLEEMCSDFEIIVVDDCSTDNTVKIVQQYSANHTQVLLVQQPFNNRQGAARNRGIKMSNGRYIAFVDADDTIDSNKMGKILSEALQSNTDVIAFLYTKCFEDGIQIALSENCPNNMIISGKDYCENYLKTDVGLAPCRYLYNSDFLKIVNRRMAEGCLWEDADWVAWHLIHANKIKHTYYSAYNYIMNPASTTHSLHYKNRADWVIMGLRKIKDAESFVGISPDFAKTMIDDGRNNVITGVQKVWKVDSYRLFYDRIRPHMLDLRQMDWPKRVKFFVHHPDISLVILQICGPLLKLVNKIVTVLHKRFR